MSGDGGHERRSATRWERYRRGVIGSTALGLLVGIAGTLPADADAETAPGAAPINKDSEEPKPLPVDVSAPSAVAGSEGRATLWLSVRNRGGDELKELQAELVGFECKAHNDPAVQRRARLQGEKKLELPAQGRREFDLTIVDGPDAGECQARLALRSKEYDPQKIELKVLFRRSIWVGVGLITGSVIISSLLRLALGAWLPARKSQRQTLLALERLKRFAETTGPFDPAEQFHLEAVHRAARRMYEELRWVTRAPSGDDVTRLEQRLDLLERYVRVRRLLKGVRLPIEQRRNNKEVLAGAERALRDADAPADLNGLIQTVRGIEESALKAIDEQLTRPLRELQAELEGQPADLQPKLEEVRDALTAVEDALVGGDDERARTRFDDARSRYFRILAEWLRASMPDSPPVGFDNTSWPALKGGMQRDLDELQMLPPDRAHTRYREIHQRYIRRILEALAPEAEAWKQELDQSPALDPEKKEELRGKLASILEDVRQGKEALASGDLGKAASLCTPAAERLIEARNAISPGSAMSGGAGAPDPAPTWPAIGELGALQAALSPAAAASLPALAEHDHGTLRAELALSAATLVIAVLTGLRLLEVRSPTWGDGSDLLVAALWGLGLHQVSGAAFSGLGEIRKLFMK